MAGKIRRELGDGYGDWESPGKDKATRNFLSPLLFRKEKRTDSRSGGLGNDKRPNLLLLIFTFNSVRQ